MSVFGGKADIAPVLRSEDRIDHPPDSVSHCRELIAVAVSEIDGDPIVGNRFVDPARRALQKNNCVVACRSQESDDV